MIVFLELRSHANSISSDRRMPGADSSWRALTAARTSRATAVVRVLVETSDGRASSCCAAAGNGDTNSSASDWKADCLALLLLFLISAAGTSLAKAALRVLVETSVEPTHFCCGAAGNGDTNSSASDWKADCLALLLLLLISAAWRTKRLCCHTVNIVAMIRSLSDFRQHENSVSSAFRMMRGLSS
jgi:hypothetical protein